MASNISASTSDLSGIWKYRTSQNPRSSGTVGSGTSPSLAPQTESDPWSRSSIRPTGWDSNLRLASPSSGANNNSSSEDALGFSGTNSANGSKSNLGISRSSSPFLPFPSARQRQATAAQSAAIRSSPSPSLLDTSSGPFNANSNDRLYDRFRGRSLDVDNIASSYQQMDLQSAPRQRTVTAPQSRADEMESDEDQLRGRQRYSTFRSVLRGIDERERPSSLHPPEFDTPIEYGNYAPNASRQDDSKLPRSNSTPPSYHPALSSSVLTSHSVTNSRPHSRNDYTYEVDQRDIDLHGHPSGRGSSYHHPPSSADMYQRNGSRYGHYPTPSTVEDTYYTGPPDHGAHGTDYRYGPYNGDRDRSHHTYDQTDNPYYRAYRSNQFEDEQHPGGYYYPSEAGFYDSHQRHAGPGDRRFNGMDPYLYKQHPMPVDPSLYNQIPPNGMVGRNLRRYPQYPPIPNYDPRGVKFPASEGKQGAGRPATSPGKQDEVKAIRSPLLEAFRNNRNMKFELEDVVGHIAEFAGDQHGSRFLQQKLETATWDEKEAVFEEILPNCLQLMTDVFGNYVVQKILEFGSQVQKAQIGRKMEGHVQALSLQMYGCRVVQKAFEHVLADQQLALIRELHGSVLRCIKDQNGNHVIQRIIERVPNDKITFVTDAIKGQAFALATHPYGCRVVQRVFEHIPEAQIYLLEELYKHTKALIQDQYGNYVVQHVIEHGGPRPDDRMKIINVVKGNVVSFSKHKFASNVVEKCLAYGNKEEVSDLIEEALTDDADGNSPLLGMMKDQFANYVIQKMLDISSGEQRERLVFKLKPQLQALKQVTFGKHIASIERVLAAADHERDPQNQQTKPPENQSIPNQ